MSSEITTAFVQQFSSNVFHLSQQQGSRLRPLVRIERQKGKSAFYDRIGSVTAALRTGRHADTPQYDTPHSRRMVTLNDYVHADLIDDSDKIRLLIDPAGDYSKAFMWAFGRAIDDVIIAAADGTAYGGETGATSVTLPNAQRIAPISGGALVNLNLFGLRLAKSTMDADDVDVSIPRHWALSASQLSSLLSETQLTSADYNSIKTLVQGEVDSFMGWKFVRIERLLYDVSGDSASTSTGLVCSGSAMDSTFRRNLAWAQDGLLLSIGEDMMSRISERDDKNYSTQVFCQMSIGATRMEEVKVIQINCNE